MLKITLSFFFILGTLLGTAKKNSTKVFVGPVVPVGKELSKVYTAGISVGIERSFSLHKALNISPGIICNYYLNNPPVPYYQASYRDHFFQYGLLLKIGYEFRLSQNVFLEPSAGAGYLQGLNYFTFRGSKDYDIGFFERKEKILHSGGLCFPFQLQLRPSQKLAVSLSYLMYKPQIRLDKNVYSNITFYGVTSSLYGPLVVLPVQKMRLHNLSILVSLFL